MAIYLRDARFVDADGSTIVAGHLRVDAGAAGSVVGVEEIPAAAEVIGCSGCIVTPAFANAHHHIYSALARGMPAPSVAPTSFVEILERIWWQVDKALDSEMIRASALVAGCETALAGGTFVIDHHASPNAAADSLHVIADALDSIGLGHLLCYELSDRDGAERRDAGFDETVAYLAQRPGLVGLHASFTVADELLARAVDLARQHSVGVHVHVAEADSDQEHCVAAHGRRVVHRLHDAGALLPTTLLVHCLHLDDAERELLAASPAWVVQNTESNQNNGVGSFSGRGLSDRVLIGTDGMHSDALRSARAAYLAADDLSPAEAVRRLRRVHDYAALAGVGGGANDLVVLDYASPTPVHADNWAAHLMYGVTSRHVRDVFRAGRPIVRDRQVVTVDHAEVLARAREQAERLWQKL